MKTNTKATVSTLTNIVSGVSLCVLLVVCIWAAPHSANAASQTWTNAPVNTNWPTPGNWVGLAAPGDINVSTANTVNNDIATFNTPLAGGIGGAGSPIVPDDATIIGGRSRRIGGITFDTANCGPYVIWSPSPANITDGTSTLTTGYLYVSQTNAIQITPSVVNSQAVTIPLLVNLPASTPGIYNLINNSTTPGVTLTINSITHAGANTRGTTFVLDGTSAANNVVTNLSEGPSAATSAGQGGGITKQGSGTWIIEGPGTFISRSTISINGGLLAIEDPAAFGNAPGATVTSNAVLRIDNVSPTLGAFTMSLGGTILMNGSGTINGITVANVATNNVTLATANSTNVMSVDSAVNKFIGGAIDSVVHISGPGTVEFTQAGTYAGNISVDAGTNQIASQGALGTGPNLNIRAGATFDTTPMGIGAIYTLDTKAFSAAGTGTVVGSTAASVSCDPAGAIDFGTKPITLTFAPSGSSGDTGHPALYCSAGNLAFHGNAVTVKNTSAPLGAGTYQLVLLASGTNSFSGAFVALMGGNGLQAGMIAEIQATPTELDLVVSAYTPKSLTWIGNDPLLPAQWDRQVSTNWLNGATPVTFNIYDNVAFNSTGSAAGTVFITNVMQPGGVVVDTSGGNYTLNGNPGIGQIAGAASLVKINTGGTLILNAANTYSGGTIISNGIVQLATDEGVSSASPTGLNDFSIFSPAVFDLNGHSNTLNGLSGSGTIDTTATGGTSTLNFGENGDSGVFTGIIQNSSGSLGIVKNGLGTEALTSSNSYVGPTIINGGTLRVSNTFTLGAGNSPVTINAGNVDMDVNLIVTNLNGAGGGIVNSSSGANTLTVKNGGEYGGIISGKIGLFINAGTLRLDGANTYSNGTIIAAGAGLAVGQAPADPGPGLVIASNNVTISMPTATSSSTTFTPPVTNVDGATVTFTSGETANNWGNAFFGSALTTNVFSGGNVSIGGALSFSNFLGTVIVTNGEVRWFNASAGGDNTTFDFIGSGGCFVRDNIDIIHLGALFGNGVITSPSVSFPGTYWIGAKGIDSDFSGTITGSNNLVKVGAGTLTLDGFASSVLSSDNLTYTNFQYGSALTNNGFTTVSNGVLVLTAPNDLTASQTITLASPTAVLDATSMGYVTNFNDGSGNPDSAIVTNGILTIVASTELTALPQVLGGDGAVKGNGVINNGTINPGFTGQAGTLTISNALTVNAGATNAFDLSDDPTGLGTPGDILNVGGTVTLSGASFIGLNALNGFINPGKYTLMKYGSLVNESGPVPPGPISNFTLGGALPNTTRATLILSNGTGEVDLVVSSLNSSNLVWVGDGISNLWDIATSANWTNPSATSALQFFQQDAVAFNSSSTNQNVVLVGSVAPGSITTSGTTNYLFGGTGNIMGDGTLTVNGPGYLVLTNTAADTFRGGTVINGGILKAGIESGANQNDLALGTSNVTVNAGGELRFGGNGGGTVVNHFVTNGITVNGGTVTAWDGQQHLTNSTVTITAAGGTFHTIFSTKNLVLDSPLMGTGNLTIASGTNTTAGQVVLNNTNNTISGTVIVTNTTLALTGFAGLSNAPTINVQQGGILDFTGKSNVTWAVISGQTLEGSGMIRGKNVIINSGATIAPGTLGTIGTLTVTNLSNTTNLAILTLNGTTSMDINRGSSPNADLILTRGTNNFGGTLNVNNVGAALQAGDTFTLFSSSLNTGSFTTVNLPALTGGLTWNNTLAANGKITVVAPVVPPTVPPFITNFSLAGANIVLTGTNGQSGATYYLMTSTNVALPLVQWKTIGTNLGAGNAFSFTGTNAVNFSLGHQFYILSSTNSNP